MSVFRKIVKFHFTSEMKSMLSLFCSLVFRLSGAGFSFLLSTSLFLTKFFPAAVQPPDKMSLQRKDLKEERCCFLGPYQAPRSHQPQDPLCGRGRSPSPLLPAAGLTGSGAHSGKKSALDSGCSGGFPVLVGSRPCTPGSVQPRER